jgi:dihydroorotase
VDRGYVREGYFADLVLVDPEREYIITSGNLLAKCHWSPFEGHTFSSSIDTTIVNGTIAYEEGSVTLMSGRSEAVVTLFTRPY